MLHSRAYVSPFSADGIQFINKNDGRSLFLGQSESVTYQFSSVTNKHLHELWTCELQEGSLRSERESYASILSRVHSKYQKPLIKSSP